MFYTMAIFLQASSESSRSGNGINGDRTSNRSNGSGSNRFSFTSKFCEDALRQADAVASVYQKLFFTFGQHRDLLMELSKLYATRRVLLAKMMVHSPEANWNFFDHYLKKSGRLEAISALLLDSLDAINGAQNILFLNSETGVVVERFIALMKQADSETRILRTITVNDASIDFARMTMERLTPLADEFTTINFICADPTREDIVGAGGYNAVYWIDDTHYTGSVNIPLIISRVPCLLAPNGVFLTIAGAPFVYMEGGLTDPELFTLNGLVALPYPPLPDIFAVKTMIKAALVEQLGVKTAAFQGSQRNEVLVVPEGSELGSCKMYLLLFPMPRRELIETI